jgi:hypothetical protein
MSESLSPCPTLVAFCVVTYRPLKYGILSKKSANFATSSLVRWDARGLKFMSQIISSREGGCPGSWLKLERGRSNERRVDKRLVGS